MNFCNSLSNNRFSKPFTSILISPVESLRLKRVYSIGSRKPFPFVLCALWNNSSGVQCKVSFAFKNKISYQVHKRILRLFMLNLAEYSKSLQQQGAGGESSSSSSGRSEPAGQGSAAIRDLMDTDDADYLGRNGDEDVSSLEYEDVSSDPESDDTTPYHNQIIDLMKADRERCKNSEIGKQWSLKRFLLRFAKSK